MENWISGINFYQIFIFPWTKGINIYGWIMLMSIFVALPCGLIGNFLIWRQIALIGDAISHSLVPGIVLAFLITLSRSTSVMFIGAIISGLFTTFLIEFLHRKIKIQTDAALGIVFSTFFAIGIILISLFADHVDLDTECVLFGDISYTPLATPIKLGQWVIGPLPVVRMGFVCVIVIILLLLFYKELLITSFDQVLANLLGIPSAMIHYGLMLVLSIVIVSAFEAVGAVLVIAMLIFPGATSLLLSNQLFIILIFSSFFSIIYTIGGIHLALLFNCSIAGSIVVTASILFIFIWILAPKNGLIARYFLSKRF